MRKLLRIARKPWFWVVFVLVQVAHPGEPLSLTLWKDFGRQTDLVDGATLHGSRTADGDLQVRCEVVRSVRWFTAREERFERELTIPEAQLEVIQNRYRLEKPLEGQWEWREEVPAEGELPVITNWLNPPTEYEALSMGFHRVGWNGGWRDEGGNFLIGYHMQLPLEEDGLRPWALLWRIVLTPITALIDLLALPKILGLLLFAMITMAGVGGH